MPNPVVTKHRLFQPTWNPVTKTVEMVDVHARRRYSKPHGPQPDKHTSTITSAGEAWTLFYRAALLAGFSDEVAQRVAFRAADNAARGRMREIQG